MAPGRSIEGVLSAAELEGGGQVLHKAYLEALASLDDAAQHAQVLEELIQRFVRLEQRVDGLLKNTLPASVAEEIKYAGSYPPRQVTCSILFADTVDFTRLAERLTGEQLVDELDRLFRGFDAVVEAHRGTKIKTIGDAYMAVFGALDARDSHALDAVESARAMLGFLERFNVDAPQPFALRVGIHSGPVIAGVVGAHRKQYDVFGDPVNIAARFESSGVAGRVNVSAEVERQTRHAVHYESRGAIPLKNKAAMDAFLVAEEGEER
jgi:class 3 adenylate cyclase